MRFDFIERRFRATMAMVLLVSRGSCPLLVGVTLPRYLLSRTIKVRAVGAFGPLSATWSCGSLRGVRTARGENCEQNGD
jgi:hypothetical protein